MIQSVNPDTERARILELDAINEEQKQRIAANPLKYMWPHQRNCIGDCREANLTFQTYDGKQYTIRGCPQFEFFNSMKKIKAFFGANRSGKTTAGIFELCCHMTGLYPLWWVGRRWDRHLKGRIFAQDFTNGVKVLTEKLHEWMPPGSIAETYRNNQKAEVEWMIKHVSGGISYFNIMSYEQETHLAEGWSGDIILFDEPPSRELYIAATRGLIDRGGLTLFTLTPLREPWLFDEIYNSKSKNVFSIISDMRHNLERINPLTHRSIGLSEEFIREYEEKLTEEVRETRMHGKFRYLAGRIWKEWDRDVHTFDRFVTWRQDRKKLIVTDGQPPSHWPRCLIIDPHDRNPHALLWIAMDETGESWAYREAYLADHTIEMVVEYIKKVEMEAREKIQLRLIDPNFGPKRYANTGNTVRDEFEQAARKLNFPMRFAFGDDHKELARKRVAEMLKFNPAQKLNLLNHPSLHIASDLKECIYQIEHYIWDEFREGDRNPKEKPKDFNDHFADCLQYYALNPLRWIKPKILEGKGNLYANTH